MYTAFVHVPKTGGTSIYAYTDQLRICNYSKDWHIPVSEFFKESHDHIFMTMIRDPYDINLSMYYMTKRNKARFLNGRQIFMDNDKNLDVASLSPEKYLDQISLNRIYPYYFDKKRPGFFDVVGTMEQSHKTFKLLSAIFEVKLDFIMLNNNPQRHVYQKYSTGYSREEFMDKHDLDYEFYFEGIQRFENLCKEYNI